MTFEPQLNMMILRDYGGEGYVALVWGVCLLLFVLSRFDTVRVITGLPGSSPAEAEG